MSEIPNVQSVIELNKIHRHLHNDTALILQEFQNEHRQVVATVSKRRCRPVALISDVVTMNILLNLISFNRV
jgi:hypothetical protein